MGAGRIVLSEEAANAVISQLDNKSIALKVKKSKYAFLGGRTSKSVMMDEFEKKADAVRDVLVQYQGLLNGDIDDLKMACAEIAQADKNNASLFKQ